MGLLAQYNHFSWEKEFNSSLYDYKIKIKSNIPLGRCLGSSAAFNTVLSTLLLCISHRNIVKEIDFSAKKMINEISVLFESVEHGTPSGIDNYVSIHGGLILFNKNKEPKYRDLH